MFTPSEIEALPSTMEQLYRSLQLNIMSDLTERLATNGKEITSAADWQINRLYELGISKDEINNLIQSTLNASDDELDRIYDEVVQSGYARNEELYSDRGKEYISYEENKELQQLVKAVKNQTKSEFKNITGSLGFAVRNPDNTVSFTPLAKFYQDTLDNGLMQIASGAFDYNTVLKKVVKTMTDSGLRSVDYASGWSNRVDVAARRALMTGFNQVVAKVNEDNAEQLGTEYFEVSYHRGARPTHQVWQGRVYSKKELETVCGLGTVTGLCGANCYHSYSPFIKGVDKPTYSEEELDRMNEEENTPKEYNGKEYTAYEAQQRQRQLETAMRADRQKIELLTQGGADYDTITGAKVRYFQRQDEYVKFSKAMGLPEQWERVTVNGKNALGSKLPKKAESVNKITAENVAKSGEIRKPIDNTIKLDKIAESTTKLKGAMDKADYDEFTKMLADSKNEPLKSLYVNYADEISDVLYSENQAYYQPSLNRLFFSYPDEKYFISTGMSKYSDLAHEYAHFFDRQVPFDGLHYTEIDTIIEHTEWQKRILKKIPSSSDEFLSAVRKDRELLMKIYDDDLQDELEKDLLSHNGGSGSVQDALDGLFGIQLKGYHGNAYYNQKFRDAKKLGDVRGIQAAYKELGIDASNQGKVMMEYRLFDASSEMWANIMSAEVNGGMELEYVKKYLPNSYNAMQEIIKKAEIPNRTVAKSVKGDILKEESNKPVTPITDKAINRIPKVDIEGYTEEQCLEIQKQHKELLKFSKEQNDNKEVAFVFRDGLTDYKPFTGSDDKLDFGTALSGMGKNLTVLHNHPRNSSFSDVDISLFKNLKSLKTLTIVKNNGDVEFITKGDNFNNELFKLEYNRLKKKIVKNNTDVEYEKFINRLLNKTKSGVIWSEKNIL